MDRYVLEYRDEDLPRALGTFCMMPKRSTYWRQTCAVVRCWSKYFSFICFWYDGAWRRAMWTSRSVDKCQYTVQVERVYSNNANLPLVIWMLPTSWVCSSSGILSVIIC